MNRQLRAGSRVFILAILFSALGGNAASPDDSTDAAVEVSSMVPGCLTVTLRSGGYRIGGDGEWQSIEMAGFNSLAAPGRPLLPARRFLVALPPGARVQSVAFRELSETPLPGRYRIRPVPPILPPGDACLDHGLGDRLQQEWKSNRDAAYSTDDAYPGVRGELNGSGTLRKYAYASVSFYPFTYHPQSGRLVHCAAAQCAIRYRLPAPGSAAARRAEALKGDTLADEQAARLLVNYHQVKDLYQPSPYSHSGSLTPHDYVIITTRELRDAVAGSSFPAWKSSLGYRVEIVRITDFEIASQDGADLPEKIRNFLRNYYWFWGIRYVLLVGDHQTIPMRYCYPHPNNHVNNWSDPANPGGAVPTDAYYADLSLAESESWDADGDGYPGEYTQDAPDFMAEVAVGRIPTSVPAKITYALDKLVSFEQDTGSWKNSALHGGAILFYENQDLSGYPVSDGATCLQLIEADLMDGWTVSRYSEQAGLAPSVYEWDSLTETAFSSDWRDGQYAVVNWAGHGWPACASRTVWTWDDGDGVPESQNPDELDMYRFIGSVTSDLDDDYPSIVFAVSCNVGYPEPNYAGNMGIRLLTQPGWGASIGVISATRGAAVGADWPKNPGGSESLVYEFNHRMIDGPAGPEKVGDALYDAKSYCHYNFGWDHYLEFQNMFVYNLYGDPALAREGAATVKPSTRSPAGGPPSGQRSP